jgi:hypothetical protein
MNAESDIQDYHEPTREELAARNNISPLAPAGAKVEPMLLLDVSGSEGDPASPDNPRPTRISVILEALPAIVEAVEEEDSEHDDNPEEEDEGGLYTVCFSDTVFNVGDLNSDNIAQKKAEIAGFVGGGTVIVPGWNALKAHYDDEFGSRPEAEQPILAALVITDGEADDADKFGKLLEDLGDKVRVAVAIVGYGKRHDRTVEQYTQIAKRNTNLRVLTFDSVTNSLVIARSLLALIGK